MGSLELQISRDCTVRFKFQRSSDSHYYTVLPVIIGADRTGSPEENESEQRVQTLTKKPAAA